MSEWRIKHNKKSIGKGAESDQRMNGKLESTKRKEREGRNKEKWNDVEFRSETFLTSFLFNIYFSIFLSSRKFYVILIRNKKSSSSLWPLLLVPKLQFPIAQVWTVCANKERPERLFLSFIQSLIHSPCCHMGQEMSQERKSPERKSE